MAIFVLFINSGGVAGSPLFNRDDEDMYITDQVVSYRTNVNHIEVRRKKRSSSFPNFYKILQIATP